MSNAAVPTASAGASPATDALSAVGAAVRQLAPALRELAAAVWHGTAGAG